MTWKEFLHRFAEHPLFHSSTLQVFPESRDYIQVQISRWVSAGRLIQIRRGWYLIAEPYRSHTIPREVIANRVVTPSYLSLEWALSFYGLIPEETPNPTSVTTARAKNFRALQTLFIYRHMKPGYFVGYTRTVLKGQKIVIALPEKALWDKLYFHLRSSRFSLGWLKELRLQNLEEFDFAKWKNYSMLTASNPFREAAFLVEEYIKETF